jgi:hypothetical protein
VWNTLIILKGSDIFISQRRVILLAIGLCASSFVIAPSAGATTPSASILLSSAVHNAYASGAVHEVIVTRRAGETLMMVNDVATDEGRQVITLSDGSSTEVIAFDTLKKAYIKGNKIGLKNYDAFPESAAVKYAGKWMKVVPSDQAWANITGSTTLKSDFETNIRILHPKLDANLVNIGGVRAYEISGKVAALGSSPDASVNLYISDTRMVMPIRLSEFAKGVSATVNWSKWGESLVLNAPSNSVPLP